jgi:hypothetical protein
MKVTAGLWIIVAIPLLSLGAYLLLDSIHHPGPYAEAGVLAGAILSTLGGVAAVLAIQQVRQRVAMARHMGRSSHVSRKSVTRLNPSN